MPIDTVLATEREFNGMKLERLSPECYPRHSRRAMDGILFQVACQILSIFKSSGMELPVNLRAGRANRLGAAERAGAKDRDLPGKDKVRITDNWKLYIFSPYQIGKEESLTRQVVTKIVVNTKLNL